jgi:hypothetical protein
MAYHVHLRPWVRSWIYVGIVCGIVAVVNILFRDLSGLQIAMIIAMGALFWSMVGIAAWGYGGIRIVPAPPVSRTPETLTPPQQEWHAASDFLYPGAGKALLPPRH